MGIEMRLLLPNETKWQENPSLINVIVRKAFPAPVISVVGAGGKTSTIEYLAKEYEILSKQVIVTTTTHMYRPVDWNWCQEESLEAVDNYLKQQAVLWIGLPVGEDKMSSPQLPFLERLKQKQIPMLIEADGARRLPFKVPGENEPVILDGSNIVIGILGMDALDRPIKEVCFRSGLTAELLQKSEDARITKEDYVKVILSQNGLRKRVTGKMEYVVILNKVDDEKREYQACQIRSMLKKQGMNNVFLTSYKSDLR